MRQPIQWLVPVAAAALLAACGQGPQRSDAASAVARLQPTRGNTAAGTVRFEQHGSRVMVNARVSGLKPNQEHGFHVHEKGDCSAPDATSAGGHFNPAGEPHGHHSQPRHHAGDMPNLRADAKGVAVASFPLEAISIGEGAANIIGKGLIVHAKPDDYTSQPTGDAGGRIACAVIQAH